MTVQTIEIQGVRMVVLPESEYQELLGANGREDQLPPWPATDENGNYPALEAARVSIARSLIEDRRKAGLSQAQLAKLAGVRQETISRIESAKVSVTPATMAKIDKVLAPKKKKRK